MDFHILGPIEAIEADGPVALGGTKQRALLGMLLLHANEVVSSDRLIDELWSGEGRDDAARALQVAMSRLRKALQHGRSADADSGLVVTRSPGYELRVDPKRLDKSRFEELVSEGRLALGAGDPPAARDKLGEALRLWRGPPLADLAYESFCQIEISRLEELRMAALEDRLRADLELGRHAELVGELRGLVSEQPLREGLRLQLMLALYRSGRQAEALEVYRDTRRMLVDQLGIEPSRDLQQLEQAILAQDAVLNLQEPEQGEWRSAPARVPDALIGREREMEELVALYEGTRSGRGALALIGGEPGVGKTRLAEAFTAHAREAGGRVLTGRCWEAGGAPPYWPWVQALRSYVREAEPGTLRSLVGGDAAELVTIVPELRELLDDIPAPAPPEASERSRFRLFESVASFLRRVGREEPVATVLDDLHAADEASLLLLRFVAGELDGARVLIVGCYRDTEVGPGGQMAEALAELARERAVHRVSLAGLSHADTARLLELTMGCEPPAELAARLYAQTEGNPLFACEVARLLASEGHPDPGEAWDARLPIPEGVKEAIGRRLQRESDRCRRVLTLASVLGREFDVATLEQASGMERDDLLNALDEAAAARLVEDVPGAHDRRRFSHVLIRDTLYEDLATARRYRLHRSVGEALERLYARNLEPHLAELAHHYLEGGTADAAKALRFAIGAGDRAASQLAYEEAARHYKSALQVIETLGASDDEQGCELLLSLGDALSRAGRGTESKEAFARAATLAESAGRAEQLAHAALGYGGRFVWGRGSTDPALIPLLERALAAVGEDDSPARVKLLARLSAALRDEPLRDRRVALANEAVEIARRMHDPVALAYALDGRWTAIEGPFRSEAGIGDPDELLSLAERIGDDERKYVAHDYRLHILWTVGNRAGVDVELDSLSRIADDLRQPAHRWHLSASRAVLALMEGRFEHAEELISVALVLGQGSQAWNAGVSQTLQLFALRREQGRLIEMEDKIRRAVREYPALPRFQCALAHLCAELGRESDARATVQGLLSHDLRREYLDAEWLLGMCLLPDVCARLEDPGLAAQVYELLLPYDGLYAEAPVEATFGSVARGLGVLAATRGRFDDAERHFNDALETERRMGARPWIAHTQHDFAAMLLDREAPGDEARARELLAEALHTYRHLGMDVWAARAAALDI